MAVSTTSTFLSSLNRDGSISLGTSKLFSPIVVRFPKLQGFRESSPLSFPRRRIFSKVEAKKQTFSSFDELLAKSDKPVFVDFYATWCGPCQFMVPILEQVSSQLKDKIKLVKIDTEKYPKIANRYNIEALPTFIIFKNGKPCDRFEGAFPADQLIQRIEHALKVAH